MINNASIARIRAKAVTKTSTKTSSIAKVIRKLSLPTVAAIVATAGATQVMAQAAEAVINLETTQAGIHQVSYSDLVANGIDLSGLDANQLVLMNQGVEVPIQVVGGSQFASGSAFRFIAKPLDTLYTDTNVYTLQVGSGSQRIEDEDTLILRNVPHANSYLATTQYAPPQKYSFTSPDKQDPWYAERIVAVGQPKSETITMDIKDVAPGGNDGISGMKMSVNVWGASNLPGSTPDHHVKVQFNGADLVSGKFDGLQAKTLEAPLQSVRNGSNQVRLTLPMDSGLAYDAVNLNDITVTYPRRFLAEEGRLNFASIKSKFRVQGFPNDDVVVMREDSNGRVVNVSNVAPNCRKECAFTFGGIGQLAHYYVASAQALHQPSFAPLPIEQDINSGSAKYLIIAHPDFIGADGDNLLEDFASELQSEMGSVSIVNVESIYAQYGNHLFDPKAIQQYIQYAHANRGTRYVLLVGGDVYDYRQFENQDARSFIPSLYASTGSNVTFAPVDAKYVDIDNDNVPDLPIGRLPVRTTSQLRSLLTKRADYVNRTYQGQALLVADEYDATQQYDFADDADEISQRYLQDFDVQTAYVDDVGVSAARNKVRDTINQGVSLTAFFGHSSTNQWSFNGLFTGPDAAGLNNAGKPTVVTQWGCWNAYHVSPNEDSMGHRFLMEGDRGAVAVMGASTLTNADAERRLATKVFKHLANGERLGDAITLAKQEHAQDNPNDLDVLLGWTLLGMPELYVD